MPTQVWRVKGLYMQENVQYIWICFLWLNLILLQPLGSMYQSYNKVINFWIWASLCPLDFFFYSISAKNAQTESGSRDLKSSFTPVVNGGATKAMTSKASNKLEKISSRNKAAAGVRSAEGFSPGKWWTTMSWKFANGKGKLGNMCEDAKDLAVCLVPSRAYSTLCCSHLRCEGSC